MNSAVTVIAIALLAASLAWLVYRSHRDIPPVGVIEAEQLPAPRYATVYDQTVAALGDPTLIWPAA